MHIHLTCTNRTQSCGSRHLRLSDSVSAQLYANSSSKTLLNFVYDSGTNFGASASVGWKRNKSDVQQWGPWVSLQRAGGPVGSAGPLYVRGGQLANRFQRAWGRMGTDTQMILKTAIKTHYELAKKFLLEGVDECISRASVRKDAV